jgi:phage-related tail protein
VGADLSQLSAALGTQLEQRTRVEAQQDARSERALLQLTAAAAALEQSLGQQGSSLKEITEQLPPLFQQTASASQAAAERALSELARVTEQRLTGVSELLSTDISQRAQREHTLFERAEQAFERVQHSAALQESALSRQSAEVEGLITRVGKLLPELVDAAQAGATQTLERLQHTADEQAARFAELEAAIERGRDEHARGLASQLQSHAEDLERRLTETSRSVEEAAAVWRASSAEMQTVAELFTNSVEKQREAAQAFSESFADVEGAVERAGRDATREALSDQLAATQEVFTRQLQFQRELFEQLRALRSPLPRVTRGEGDADAAV